MKLLNSGKKPQKIFSLAVMVFFFMALTAAAVPAFSQDDVTASSIVTETSADASIAEQKAHEADTGLTAGDIVIRIIIVLAALIALFVIYICLPVIPAFQSKLDPAAVIEHIGESKGKGKKILIGYVTRLGSSSSIAQKMYDVLVAKGRNVDMRFIPNIKDDEVDQYDSFILGSSVYWVMAVEFQDFVARHKETLKKKPFYMFANCMTIQRDTPKNRERVAGYFTSGLKKVPGLEPMEKMPFAGKVDLSRLNGPERTFLQFFFLITPLKGGDHRDFSKVQSWTEKINEKL